MVEKAGNWSESTKGATVRELGKEDRKGEMKKTKGDSRGGEKKMEEQGSMRK